MNRLKHLTEETGRLTREIRAIAELCEREQRSRSLEEKTKYAGLKTQVDDMAEEITFLEEVRAKDELSKRPVRKYNQETGEFEGGNGVDTRAGVDGDERRFLDKVGTVSIITSRQKLARPEDREEVSVGDLIAARIRGPRNEREARGLTTALDAAGGLSTKVSRQFFDQTRVESVLVQAGASVLDFESGGDAGGIVKFPTITSLPVATWKQELALGTLSDPVFTSTVFDPSTLFICFLISNEMVQDGGSILGEMINQSVTSSAAVELDRAALFGSGAANFQPLGLANIPGINTVDMLGNDFESFDPMVQSVKKLLEGNVKLSEVGPFVMAPRTWEDLSTLKSATDLQQLGTPSQIGGIPWVTSSKIPINQGASTDNSTAFVGKWSDLVIGVRLHLKIKFYEQPAAQNFATMVVAAMRADVQVKNIKSFTKIVNIGPTGALALNAAAGSASGYAAKKK